MDLHKKEVSTNVFPIQTSR